MVGIGFMYAAHPERHAVVMPPSSPPARFVVR